MMKVDRGVRRGKARREAASTTYGADEYYVLYSLGVSGLGISGLDGLLGLGAGTWHFAGGSLAIALRGL
jgi:hypothetical protein